MDPVLLYTDTNRINKQQATLANMVPVYQAIYTAIKAVGVTATIAEINSLVQSAKMKDQTPFVNNYIMGKMVAAVSPYVVNGVTFTSAAVASFIQLPDTSGVTAALQPVWGGNAQNIFVSEYGAPNLNLLALADDVISAVAGANATIAELYAYYTATDASATLANSLQAVCDALNTFDAANNNFYAHKTPVGDERWKSNASSTAIAGLELTVANTFVVSLNFIREYEKIGNLNFFRNQR